MNTLISRILSISLLLFIHLTRMDYRWTALSTTVIAIEGLVEVDKNPEIAQDVKKLATMRKCSLEEHQVCRNLLANQEISKGNQTTTSRKKK